MPAATPVLDTLADINTASIEHTHLMPRELMLARLAALVAVDAPPGSYLANAGPATDSGITEQDVQDILIAVAPVVGTAKVVSAGGNLMRALGFAIAVAEDGPGQAFASLAEARSRPGRAFCAWQVGPGQPSLRRLASPPCRNEPPVAAETVVTCA